MCEFVIWFCLGILIALCILSVIGMFCLVTYIAFKALFFIFEKLGIENPIIIIFDWIRDMARCLNE